MLVDDFEIPVLFHNIGFRAVLPAESIASLDWMSEETKQRAFEKLAQRIRYVDGDYRDAGTFEKLCAALEGADAGALWSASGEGGRTFWQGVDLTIAMAASWLPLAADYTRFARTGRAAFWGTSVGYFVPLAWLYALGNIVVSLAGGLGAASLGYLVGAATSTRIARTPQTQPPTPRAL